MDSGFEPRYNAEMCEAFRRIPQLQRVPVLAAIPDKTA